MRVPFQGGPVATGEMDLEAVRLQARRAVPWHAQHAWLVQRVDVLQHPLPQRPEQAELARLGAHVAVADADLAA
ncbi:hypothetical protein HMPREF3024_24970 [Achromobacter xylosoxidans]|nr:hypothetical protein HMPREF3024_24970 [Achromobacter xylosoxidans]OMG75997.1 hypothetical protein BIZ53_21650 [Achromobacter xylosoxidans]